MNKPVAKWMSLFALLLALLTGCGAIGGGPDTAPESEASSTLSAGQLAGRWHLADETDMEALSEAFPGAAEFGSGMEIGADGSISWYIGAFGAAGTYSPDGSRWIAAATGDLDQKAYTAILSALDAETLTMEFENAELIWSRGEGETLRGEDR